MHRQYLWPAADVGSIGPTTPIVIRLNAISSLGIGVIGTLSITKLLAFNWHISQDLQNLSISRLILGQTKDNLILSLVFSSPRCPPNGSSCANDITLILLSFSLSSSSLAFASSRFFCNLCARVITFACTTTSRLMITCGMAFNSAMISGCSKNFLYFPSPQHMHILMIYTV